MITAKAHDINEYISWFPPNVQQVLQEVRATIHDAAPDATEAISYAMPTFKLNGNLVHFAAFKNHIGFYPAPTGIEAFQQDVSIYKTGRGSIQFPLNQPMPLQLITKMVKWRVNEVSANVAKKQAKSS